MNNVFTKHLVKYVVWGLLRYSVGYFVYLVLTYFGVEPRIAMTLLYFIGTVVGFFLNRKYVFSHKSSITVSGLKYIGAHLCGYSLNLLVMYVVIDLFGYPHQFSQIVAIFVVAPFLFVVFKFFVFRDVRFIVDK